MAVSITTISLVPGHGQIEPRPLAFDFEPFGRVRQRNLRLDGIGFRIDDAQHLGSVGHVNQFRRREVANIVDVVLEFYRFDDLVRLSIKDVEQAIAAQADEDLVDVGGIGDALDGRLIRLLIQ